jgi:hypothetical protein
VLANLAVSVDAGSPMRSTVHAQMLTGSVRDLASGDALFGARATLSVRIWREVTGFA